MELTLDGKVILITGAASGIGRACAMAFAAEGARLGLIDRESAALATLVVELGADTGTTEVHAVTADVTDEPGFAAAIDAIAEYFGQGEKGGAGRIDGVVGCAGVSGPFGQDVADIALAEWNAVFAVNAGGQFLLVKAAVPHLRRSSAPTVVFIASDSGFVAAPGMVPYCSSKGAVVQLTKALSVDLAGYGIRVNCVCPSIVDTPMSRVDLGRETTGFAGVDYPVQTPDDVANHVLYLSSQRSRPINGVALLSDFGYAARSSFPA
ncbi:SDR family NAD(P)-dependent oxidoreductase [Luethyella okanaganae]|uniref:SDR family NAD(P)-dependent oxidoreductase n=1 Tax=Luethyella okanaganae TaxID=69372 RepID=A0ABW1VDI5_9MICO